MDKLSAMTIFTMVADARSFAEAARRLSLSPPAVTRAVNALEDGLGVRLLHRTTRQVRLTPAGERYRQACRSILDAVAEADASAVGTAHAPEGMVRLSAPVLFGQIMVMPLIMRLLDTFPKIQVDALFLDRLVHLMDEDVDVAVRIGSLPDSGLAAIKLGQVRRQLFASPDYLATRGTPTLPDQLRDHDCVVANALAPQGIWVLNRGSVTPPARFGVNSGDAALKAVLGGFGIGRLLSYQASPHLAEGRLVPVLDDYEPAPMPVHIIHREMGRTSSRVRTVVDYLVQALRHHPALQP